MMSKVPFNPKTATHALRGLAFGTSCSLILISEERRRRLDLARTLVDNGRLIKAQRCYSTAGAAAASLQVERAGDPPATEEDTALKPDWSWHDVGLAKETPPPPPTLKSRRYIQHPIFPEKPKHSAMWKMVKTKRLPPLNAESVFSVYYEKKSKVLGPAPEIPSPLDGDDAWTAWFGEFKAVWRLSSLPSEFLESTMSLLRTLEQKDNVPLAQALLDELLHHPATDPQHFDSISPEFLLRCVLSPRGYAGLRDQPGRKYKIAVSLFWSRRKLLASPQETGELMDMMAELFAVDDAQYEIQSFLATSHLHWGRYTTAKHLAVPIAIRYRKQGRTALLDRWLELADTAGAPIHACYTGRNLMTKWERQDDPEETGAPRDRCVLRLNKELRRPLSSELEELNEEQRGLFDRMDEKAKKREWEEVLGCYSEGLGAGMEGSVPCLRLAVEAAVGLEGIHTPKALKLIEEAHEASVDVNSVVQTLLLSRFHAIEKHQEANHTPDTRGQAYKTMRRLLDTVQPYYKQPSEIVYNRAIRVCLRVSELKEARDLCLQVAQEHWNGDVIYKPYNFASLLAVAVRMRDFDLLRKVLETLPWRSYRDQPMCRLQLMEAKSTLWAMMRNAKTTQESQMYEGPLGNLEIAFSTVRQARAARHARVRWLIRYNAPGVIRSRKKCSRHWRAADGADERAAEKSRRWQASATSVAPPKQPSSGLGRWLVGLWVQGEQACKRVLGS